MSANNGNGNKKPWNNNWKKPWFNKNKNNGAKKNNANENENPENITNTSYQKKKTNYSNKSKFNNDNDVNDSDTFDAEVSHAIIFDSSVKVDQNIIDPEENTQNDFKMWNLYFPHEKYEEDSDTDKTIKAFMFLIHEWKDKFALNDVVDKNLFEVNFRELCNSDIIKERLERFEENFDKKPEFYLNCLGIAMHQHIMNRYTVKLQILQENNEYDVEEDEERDITFYNHQSMPAINVRMLNYNKQTRIKDLKAIIYDEFISVTGTVVKISNIRPFVKRLAFECQGCNTTFQLILIEGKYQHPSKCVNKVCNSRHFTRMRDHFMSKVVQWQKITLQEVILDHSDQDSENGRIPRTIDCELTEDLTDSCLPGDLVTVNGVVKALSGQTVGTGRTNKDKCSFFFYISVNSVQSMISVRDQDNSGKKTKNIEFTPKNLKFFDALLKESELFKVLVNSLCPSIFGHELVKAGLLLGLLGGSQKFNALEEESAIRSDAHILVVGDPGLGKSQLLRACANVSPRGVFVCGNATTSAGLTVTLSKESGDGFAIEAGALLCAHNGTCCIDEFDKMGNQQQTLLEVMEQQCISLAKGGMVATLPCKTTVLAAANPIGGHYNKAKTVSENIKLSGPLLSRFDLLFILLDKPNNKFDWKLSEHVLSLHSKGFKNISDDKISDLSSDSIRNTQGSHNISLEKKLELDPSKKIDFVPSQLLRKYIMYAKANCNPVIGPQAVNVLRAFYIELRETNFQNKGSNPITMRQLESLVRLTQARAKCEMRNVCSENDALEVVELMRNSMIDLLANEDGEIDYSDSMNGSLISEKSILITSGKINSKKALVDYLTKLSNERNNNEFKVAELTKIIQSSSIKKKDPEKLICELNNEGCLIKKSSDIYKLIK